MRWIGRGICIAVVFIVIGLIGLNIDIVPLRVERSDGSLIDVRTATPVITYRLDKRDWLDFAVAGNGPRLKILTNAIIDTSLDDCQPAPSSKLAQDAKPAPCRYAVEYQLLNADDELLSSRQYHFVSRLERVERVDPKQIGPTTRYESGLGAVTETRGLVIPIAEYQNLRRVRLRMRSADESINAVTMRLYQIEPVLEHRLDQRWARLRLGARKQLAKASAYSAYRHLLTRMEKRNLVRNRWQPVGPESNDVLPLRVFIATEESIAPIAEQTTPPGQLIDQGRPLAMEVDPDVAMIKIRHPDDSPASGVKLNVNWQGRRYWQTRSFDIYSNDLGESLLALGPGRLMISAGQPVYLDVVSSLGEAITPVPQRLRLYRSDRDASVEFTVDHIDGYRSPLRLDFRQLIPADRGADTALEGTVVDVEFRDRDARLIVTHAVELKLPVSEYDHLTRGDIGVQVSEPLKRYFNVDQQVATIRVRADNPITVNAYTRPPDVAHQVAFAGPLSDRDPRPMWFTLLPADADRYRWNQRGLMLAYQPRPIERRAELFDDAFEFQRLMPIDAGDATTTPWFAKYILSIRDPEQPQKATAAANVYHRVAINRDIATTVLRDVNDTLNKTLTSPRLAYWQASPKPFDLVVKLDGAPVFAERLGGQAGHLRLPPLPVGRQRLRFEVGGQGNDRFALFAAGASPPEYREQRQRLLAYPLSATPLTFQFQHDTGNELISVRVYPETSGPAVLKIRARIEAARRAGALPSYTVKERVFILEQSTGDDSAIVLGKRARAVGPGHVFYIAIGEDIKPGPVRIHLERESDQGGYVMPTRLRPRRDALRRYVVQRFNDETLDF